MVNQKIKTCFLVFIVLSFIPFTVHSDQSKPQNELRKSADVRTKTLTFNGPDKKLEKKNVQESYLEKSNLNGIGLISIDSTKFPDGLWSNSNEKVLSEKLNNMPKLSLASTSKIYKRLLLVDAKPPLNSIGMKNMGYLFLLSRIDQLINLGAIDEAEEILNYMKEPSIELMKRKIEVASLNGRLSKTCDLAKKYPNFDGLLQFKIICLVRGNDWQTAALAFTVGSSLRQFDKIETQLLLNYLDPDIESDFPDTVMLNNLSPTSFYLMHGEKKLIPSNLMPDKYAYAFSQSDISPKIRIKSMEQLASNYVINANTLFNVYRSSPLEERQQNDNPKLTVKELDQSFRSDNEQKKLLALKKATKLFQKKNLLAQLSNEYTNELKSLGYSFDEQLRDLAITLLSLTDSVRNDFLMLVSNNPDINCLIDIKKGVFVSYKSDTRLCQLVKELNIEIIRKSFPRDKNYNDQTQKGLILLESLSLLKNGFLTEFEDLKLSLSMLTKIGLINLVNEISVELIALDVLKNMVK